MAKKRLVDLSQELVQAAARGLGFAEAEAPSREVIDAAVAGHLDEVVGLLKQAGLTAQPTGRRRPRAISDGTWSRLEDEAALSHNVTADPGRERPGVEGGKVALTQAELLRACLVLASRRGGATPPEQGSAGHGTPPHGESRPPGGPG